jgi:glucose dehydrogenase
VKNYVPVTDAMLRDPDPGDWLMIRRNYKAWSYSPLTEISAGNVKELQLAWSWAMNDGVGSNEPTPIVHNGIMYLAHVGNIVQALDARSGELIWENRLGPALSNGQGAIRSLAIYQDKIYLAATDARLVALDARTGKMVWETRIADPAKGYGNTSGPLIIQGKVIQGMGGCDRYKETGCYISAYDAQSGKQLWKFETVAREGAPGGDTWGKLPNLLRAGGDTWITGSYDPDLDLTYWGTAQAKPWMPSAAPTTRRSTRPRPWRSGRTMDRWPGISSMCRANRSIWMKCSSGCWSIRAARIWCSASARPASCGSSIARPESFWITKRPFSRTSTTTSIRRPARCITAMRLSSSARKSGCRPVHPPKAATTGKR